MWIRPAPPSSSAVQPMDARTVSVLRSGCRRNRQASSAASTGITQAREPNASTAAVRMARPAALSIRPHRLAASTMATPRVSSPTPSRRWCGSRSRAPRPMARAANPTAPAATIQAAAIVRPIHPIRITTGSWDGPPRADGPWPDASSPYPASRPSPGRSFSSDPNEAGCSAPAYRSSRAATGSPRFRVPGSACRCRRARQPRRQPGTCPSLTGTGVGQALITSPGPGPRAGPASPPRGRADPLRARVTIVTNVARTWLNPKHIRLVSAHGAIGGCP